MQFSPLFFGNFLNNMDKLLLSLNSHELAAKLGLKHNMSITYYTCRFLYPSAKQSKSLHFYLCLWLFITKVNSVSLSH